jgi:hypothetical protein
MRESACFLCAQARADLISLAQLRTTLTARPLLAVFCAALALSDKQADAETICLKCSELLDQIDTLGLQLKLKTDELRTLYYSSRKAALTKNVALSKEDPTKLRRCSVRTRKRPIKRPASRQCPCHESIGHKKCARSSSRRTESDVSYHNILSTEVPVERIAGQQVESGELKEAKTGSERLSAADGSAAPISSAGGIFTAKPDTGNGSTGSNENNDINLHSLLAVIKCPDCNIQITGDEAALGKCDFVLFTSGLLSLSKVPVQSFSPSFVRN